MFSVKLYLYAMNDLLFVEFRRKTWPYETSKHYRRRSIMNSTTTMGKEASLEGLGKSL